jgi:uncharacterized protein YodC (DUF2158 family)
MDTTLTDTRPATTLSPGDVVMVRSGGPTMTVTAIIADLASCIWFAEDEEVFRFEELPTVALIPVDFDADEDADEDDDATATVAAAED